MWHFRVTAGVTVERLPSVRDYVQSTKPHRPAISSLILTLNLCSVALSFALPYMDISSAIDWVIAGSSLGHRWVIAGSSLGHRWVIAPGRCRRAAMTIARHAHDQIKRDHPHIVALIFFF